MMAQALFWWSGRSERERVLLGIMGLLLGLMLFWLLVIRPINAGKAAAQLRLDTATESAGRVAAVADAVRRARRTTPVTLSASLPVAVGKAAETAGLTLSRLDPQGTDRVVIGISTVRSTAVFGWLGALQQQGVIVERMTLRTNSDATLAVEATLRVRAR